MADMDGRTAGQEGDFDTFPRYLMHHAQVRPQRPAMREKKYGIWQTYSWSQVAQNVRAIACGLAQLGFIERRGGLIFEGPLLDVLLDYRLLADRIIYGTLGEVLAQSGHPPPSRDAFTPPEPENAEDDAEEND